MRQITERNAKVIEEVLTGYIAGLQEASRKSTRVHNKVRLAGIALRELRNNKITKNGRIESK